MIENIKRREFLKLVSLGGAATVLSNCTQPVERVIPYLVAEEDVVPGQSTYFATVCRECSAGCGVVMRTQEGRAIKPEGNPDHPVNAGKLCMAGQASVQGLYNPDRFRQAMRVEGGNYSPVSWADAQKEFHGKLAAAASAGADKVAYVSELQTGTYRRLIGEFMESVNSTQHTMYEPISYKPLRTASQKVFGIDAIPFYDLTKAQTIISFGADFLETWLSPVEYGRQFAAMRAVKDGRMGYFAYVGPRMSTTGANADKWVSIRPGQEVAVALAVLNEIVAKGNAKNDLGAFSSLIEGYTPDRVASVAGVEAGDIRSLAIAFAKRPSVALAGNTVANAEALAVVVNLLNYAVGNIGRSVQYGPQQAQGFAQSDLDALIEKMNAGDIQVLVLDNVNPSYSLPVTAKWDEALKKVPYVVAITPFPSESTAKANLVLAAHHGYESWGDSVSREGVYGLLQPVMRPIFNTKSPGDLLLAAKQAVKPGSAAFESYEAYLRGNWQSVHQQLGSGSFESWFREALQRGGVFVDAPEKTVSLSTDASGVDVKAPAIEGTALVSYASSRFFDGRHANRPWLQETPDPMTRIAWMSWVEVNPKTAAKLGVTNGEVLSVETPMGTIEAPAYVYRGIREDVFGVPLGQGHTPEFGRYAGESHSSKGWLEVGKGKRGANPLEVLPPEVLVSQATVKKAGRMEPLALLQGSDTQHGREILQLVPINQVGMLAQQEAKKVEEAHAKAAAGTKLEYLNETHPHSDEHPLRALEPGTREYRVEGQLGNQPGQNFYVPVDHPEYRFGMTIDLNSCTGCGACTVACMAENNVPIVGPELVAKGREMAWLWIDRYYIDEDPENPEASFIPSLCQHCTNAPCESVCPVYATYHNPDGLNAQVYNRCVGTRYCANNCPYKVRRFNWFTYEWPEPLHMQLNPSVSVRTKGIMEKCTFCMQRIREAKDYARDEDRMVQDGDVVTACAQTCPTDAIVFGDLKDPNSRVSQLTRNPRGYRVLEELATQPAITYLREVVQS